MPLSWLIPAPDSTANFLARSIFSKKGNNVKNSNNKIAVFRVEASFVDVC
jgi:hypothetical protein